MPKAGKRANDSILFGSAGYRFGLLPGFPDALLEFIGKTYQLTKEENKNARRYRVLKNCDAKQR